MFALNYSQPSASEELRIAVASNFSPVIKQIAAQFEQTTDHRLLISSASTGQLYSQITNGAPFDLFFSADSAHIDRIVDQSLGLPESRFTYAVGQIAFWKPSNNNKVDRVSAVNAKGKTALANPKVAPYGVAARQVIDQLFVLPADSKKYKAIKYVNANNVGQAFQYVYSGNCKQGFVSLTHLITHQVDPNQYWIIPSDLYTPLDQQVIILKRSKQVDLSHSFLAFVKSKEIQRLIKQAGYQLQDAMKNQPQDPAQKGEP